MANPQIAIVAATFAECHSHLLGGGPDAGPGLPPLDAVIARRPQVALVDELAHPNVPGSKHLERYQDVLALCEHGINVISTVNVQHLSSLQDTVRLLAGVTVSETLPDWVLDAADGVEMVNQAPEALRKRLLRGHVQPKAQVERPLGGSLRRDTLTAWRELTMWRVALHAERKLQEDRDLDGFSRPSLSAGTVLVCVLRRTTDVDVHIVQRAEQ